MVFVAAKSGHQVAAKLVPPVGILMGCAKCGGRMLTKVGRKKPMLICSDCGHPVAEVKDPERSKRQRHGSLFMLALAAVALMAFFLTQLRERTSNGNLPAERIHREQGIFAR
jgi:hypothetical protein